MDSEDGRHTIQAQRAAANNYQQVWSGPLVGDQLPSASIPQEYAKADSIYVEKTQLLAQTYSSFRPIRGDGNCGWRAIGFSYFEQLAQYGTLEQIQSEVNRLKGWDEILESNPQNGPYLEDFKEPFGALLQGLTHQLNDRGAARSLVHTAWNTEEASDAMVYYLRLLAAEQLKADNLKYEPYIEDGLGVDGYTQTVVRPLNREIEHIGIDALYNILLRPINVVLEIAYLDLSPGSSVREYRFGPENDQKAGPAVHLLYRPTHYDVLYNDQIVNREAHTGQTFYQVNRVTEMSHNMNVTATPAMSGLPEADYASLSLIPGFSNINGGFFNAMMPMVTSGPIEQGLATQHWAPEFDQSLQHTYVVGAPRLAMPMESVDRLTPESPNPTVATSTPGSIEIGNPSALATNATGPSEGESWAFRTTMEQMKYDDLPPGQFQVQTPTFKNSVWNTAHYGNPKFHPEEWDPSDERTDGRTRRTQRRDC